MESSSTEESPASVGTKARDCPLLGPETPCISSYGILHLAWWVIRQWQTTAFLTCATLQSRCCPGGARCELQALWVWHRIPERGETAQCAVLQIESPLHGQGWNGNRCMFHTQICETQQVWCAGMWGDALNCTLAHVFGGRHREEDVLAPRGALLHRALR